jgi:hypothetical protein
MRERVRELQFVLVFLLARSECDHEACERRQGACDGRSRALMRVPAGSQGRAPVQ